jgi:hypothetical protein
VKMNLLWLAVTILLTVLSMPASLMADGNPWPHMKAAQAPNVEQPAPPPDGNPWPH